MLLSNKFFTPKKNTSIKNSPSMTKEQEEKWLANTLQKHNNSELKKTLNSYTMMTPSEKEELQSKYYTKDQMHMSNLRKRIHKLGGKQNKTKRPKNRKTQKNKK